MSYKLNWDGIKELYIDVLKHKDKVYVDENGNIIEIIYVFGFVDHYIWTGNKWKYYNFYGEQE